MRIDYLENNLPAGEELSALEMTSSIFVRPETIYWIDEYFRLLTSSVS